MLPKNKYLKRLDNYIIFTSAYNEASNIEKTIKSVIKQNILPNQWIIVNDGSTDNTAEIILNYKSKYNFIDLLTKCKSNCESGAHVGINWQYAKKIIKDDNWKYIAQLDADIELDRDDFYEYQIRKFNEDPSLGISSGITYNIQDGIKILTSRPYWRTGGATKMYRRACFNAIGEFIPVYAWDGLDVYKAMFLGWRSRTQYELYANHLAKNRMVLREREIATIYLRGKNLYQRGFPIEFVILKAFFLLRQSRAFVKAFIKGYTEARKLQTRYVNKVEIRFNRKIQYLRLFDKISKKRLL